MRLPQYESKCTIGGQQWVLSKWVTEEVLSASEHIGEGQAVLWMGGDWGLGIGDWRFAGEEGEVESRESSQTA